jgi:hypothetical protein
MIEQMKKESESKLRKVIKSKKFNIGLSVLPRNGHGMFKTH